MDITEAREKRSDSSEQKFSQSGITVALSVPVIESVQGVAQMASAVQDTRSERAKAMGAAMAALKTREALAAGEAAAKSLADGKVPEGVSLSVSLGSSQNRSNSASTGDSGRGSSVAAGGDVTIRATGGGISGETASDLTVRGSSVQAGGDITLKADNRVRLLSGQDTSAQSGSDSSGSAAIGLSVGLGAKSAGLSLTASASRALGSSNGSATTQQDSTVAAGKKLTIDSGGDTDILGATASGETVKVAVGGNLNMASRQDTATFKEDSKNIGFNASIPIPGVSTGTASVSLSAGKTKIRSDYASTQTTSGLKAGDGGFDVQVKGKTLLDGAVIASSDKAVAEGKNRFSSDGGLELKDITNSAKYSADSVSAGVGISGGKPDNYGEKPAQKSGPTLNSAGIGTDSGNASSITQAGISGIAGDTAVRSGDVGSGIKPIFDADRARADVNAQGVITKEFGPVAAKEWGTLANSMAQKAQAEGREKDVQKWAEGGIFRAAGHAVLGGLTGGTAGAVGGSASSLAAPVLGDVQAKLAAGLESAGLSDKLAQSLAGATVATAAGVTGAAAGGTAAGVAALNQDANNRQLHPDEIGWIKKNAVVFASKENIPLDVAEKRLAQQAARDTDFLRYLTLQDGGPNIGRTDAAAEKFLAGNSDTFVNEEGNRQKLFTTTGNQYLRPEMYGPDTDMAFVQKNILPGTTRTPGQGLKDAGVQLGRTVANDPVGAAKAAGQAGWSAVGSLAGGAVDCVGSLSDCGVKTLKSAADSLSNTGQALGEGTATLLDPASRKRLNDLYGQDMTGAQAVITAGRGVAAVVGAVSAGKMTDVAVGAAKTAADDVAAAIGKKLDDVAEKKAATLEAEAEVKRKRIENNIYAEGASSSPAGLYTSAGVIPANPSKTTTVLGRWSPDLKVVIGDSSEGIKGQLNPGSALAKTEEFGAKPGGFNVLNVPKSVEDAVGSQFFEKVNKPFLDEAIKRGDDIALATIPKKWDDVFESNGNLKGNFAKELDWLVRGNHKPVNVNSAQWEFIKGWFK